MSNKHKFTRREFLKTAGAAAAGATLAACVPRLPQRPRPPPLKRNPPPKF